MRRKSKQLLALLMTLFMCFAPLASLAPTTAVFAEEPQSQVTSDEVISLIDFDDSGDFLLKGERNDRSQR